MWWSQSLEGHQPSLLHPPFNSLLPISEDRHSDHLPGPHHCMRLHGLSSPGPPCSFWGSCAQEKCSSFWETQCLTSLWTPMMGASHAENSGGTWGTQWGKMSPKGWPCSPHYPYCRALLASWEREKQDGKSRTDPLMSGENLLMWIWRKDQLFLRRSRYLRNLDLAVLWYL